MTQAYTADDDDDNITVSPTLRKWLEQIEPNYRAGDVQTLVEALFVLRLMDPDERLLPHWLMDALHTAVLEWARQKPVTRTSNLRQELERNAEDISRFYEFDRCKKRGMRDAEAYREVARSRCNQNVTADAIRQSLLRVQQMPDHRQVTPTLMTLLRERAARTRSKE